MMERKKEFSVNFQDIGDTNTLLKKQYQLRQKPLHDQHRTDGMLAGRFQRKEDLDRNLSLGLYLIASCTEILGLSPKQGQANLSLTLYDTAEKRVVSTYQNDDCTGTPVE